MTAKRMVISQKVPYIAWGSNSQAAAHSQAMACWEPGHAPARCLRGPVPLSPPAGPSRRKGWGPLLYCISDFWNPSQLIIVPASYDGINAAISQGRNKTTGKKIQEELSEFLTCPPVEQDLVHSLLSEVLKQKWDDQLSEIRWWMPD